MIILLVIGILLLGGAIGVVAHVLSPGRQDPAEGLTHIERYGFRKRPEEAEESGGRMLSGLDSVASRLGAAVGGKSAAFDLSAIQTQLTAAGMYKTTPGKFLGYRILCTIGVPLLWIWFAATVHVGPVLAVLATIVAVAAGWFLPLQVVKDQHRLGKAKDC